MISPSKILPDFPVKKINFVNVVYLSLLICIISPFSSFAAYTDLKVSQTADRSNPERLDGSKITKGTDIYVFLFSNRNIKKVTYYLNNEFFHEEKTGPYDFSGTAPNANLSKAFNTRNLPLGKHSITGIILLTSGQIIRSQSFFQITPYRLVYATATDSADRSKLHLAKVKYKLPLYVYISTPTDIDKVDFYIDGKWYVEDYARPFEMTKYDIQNIAIPIDTNQLSLGNHVISAEIRLTDKSKQTIRALFTLIHSQETFEPVITQKYLNTPLNSTIDIAQNRLANNSLALDIIYAPKNGGLLVNGHSLNYIPYAGFTGKDRVVYEISNDKNLIQRYIIVIEVLCETCSAGQLLTLAWEKNNENISGYRIYFSQSKTAPARHIATRYLSDTNFNPKFPSSTFNSKKDLLLKKGEIACFKLAAFNKNGNSAFSDLVCQKITL